MWWILYYEGRSYVMDTTMRGGVMWWILYYEGWSYVVDTVL